MKTPREILFDHHRSAEPKLDALRQEVLAQLPKTQPREPLPIGASPDARWSLRELLLSFRWHLAGMSAAWLLVTILNFEQAPASAPVLARQGTPPPPRQLLMALRENRRQLWELLQPPVPPPPPAVPHAFAPPRGSKPSTSFAIA